MADSQELEDFQDLLSTPGWRRFVAHVERQLSEPLLDLLSRIAKDPNDLERRRQVDILSMNREFALQMLAWPQRRVDLLRQKEDTETQPSRAQQLRTLPNRGKR